VQLSKNAMYQKKTTKYFEEMQQIL